MSEQSSDFSRRDFLKGSAAASGLVIGFYIMPGFLQKALAQAPQGTTPVYPPNAFIQIAPDQTVTFTINKIEMGQGVFTSLSQMIAEELDCDWNNVVCKHAPVAPVYNHTTMPFQLTGGSTAVASSYDQHRKIGAMARTMLLQAAANKWNVSVDSLTTENGYILNSEKGKLSYGELSEAANKLPLPTEVKLKDAKSFKLIGKSKQRLDALDKSTGKAVYGMDVRVPGMLYAVVLRPPVFGASLKDFDSAKAKAINGVIDVVKIENRIFVIGKNTWVARQGRDALLANWNMNGKDKISSDSLIQDFKKLSTNPSIVVKSQTEAVEELKKTKDIIDAEYTFPYLAHAAMEPLNCTVQYDGKSAEVWAGHQGPTWDQAAAMKVLGLPAEKVKLNTVYAGGGFGRRGNALSDFTVEACLIAKVLKKPVKVVWTREDDMRGGFYRPMVYHRARISADKAGLPHAWYHTIVGQSIMAGGPLAAFMSGGVDPTLTEGVSDTKYAIPRFHMDIQMPTLDVPVLWFRSVGHTHTSFVMETLIDELAHKAKKDSLEYRKTLLKEKTRHLAVLDLLKKKSPWGKKAPKGHAYGLAIEESFNTVVGHVVEVSVQDKNIKVHKVWSAVHCGRVVNPDGARTQVEGGIAFAISAALYGQIQIKEGKVLSGNFNDYPVIRMSEMPKVEVHFVESTDNPTGLGEPGVPPVAPALANALFHLTNKRMRDLPLKIS